MIKKQASYAVVVRDEKKATDWYKTKLGFDIKTTEGHCVTVSPKGVEGAGPSSLQNKAPREGKHWFFF